MSPGCEVPIDREEIQSVPLDRILLCPAETFLEESFADILMICCRPCDLLCRFSADGHLDYSGNLAAPSKS